MNEEILNKSIRQFLKKVGIRSQQAIEQAIHDGISAGRLQGNEQLTACMELTLDEVGLTLQVEGDIALDDPAE